MNYVRKFWAEWAAAALILSPMGVMAQNGIWTNAQSGSWSDTNNWLGGVIADGAGQTGDFSRVDYVVDVTHHLDSPRSIGRLVLGDTNIGTTVKWALDDNGNPSNILTLAASSGIPGITVTNENFDGTINAALNFSGTRYDVNIPADSALTLADDVDTSGAVFEKNGDGVLNITGEFGRSVVTPEVRFNGGTINLISNSFYASYAPTPTQTRDISIVADHATIEIGWSIELRTVNFGTGIFDMHGGSLTLSRFDMGTGNFGANQSIMTFDDGAVVNVSSGIRMGDNQGTGGGAECFVFKDGSMDTRGGTIVIGVRAGENVFNHLGGTITTTRNTGTPFNGAPGALTMQYRMNKHDNYACLYNLNGGTLVAGNIVTGDGTPFLDVNNSYFNFHGGTLKPAGSDTNFFRTTITGEKASVAAPHIVVWSEGADFDTDGHSVTCHLPWEAPEGSGLYADTNGSLTVSLIGTNGGYGYKATPLVRIGSLISGNTATAIANMADDGTSNRTLRVESIRITNPGMNYVSAPAVTISGGDPTVAATPPVLTVAPNGSSSLTKWGLGTLTLASTNSYTGDTIINGGTLALMQASLADDADVHIADGAVLAIGFDGEDIVRSLYLNGALLPQGEYYAGSLSAIGGSGAGVLKVTSGPITGMRFIVR